MVMANNNSSNMFWVLESTPRHLVFHATDFLPILSIRTRTTTMSTGQHSSMMMDYMD